MKESDIGVIGLAVMGENLVLNIESRGYKVSVFNRSAEVTERFAEGRAAGKEIFPSLRHSQKTFFLCFWRREGRDSEKDCPTRLAG